MDTLLPKLRNQLKNMRTEGQKSVKNAVSVVI